MTLARALIIKATTSLRPTAHILRVPQCSLSTTSRVVKAGSAAPARSSIRKRPPVYEQAAPTLSASAPLEESYEPEQQDVVDDKSYFPGTADFDSPVAPEELDDFATDSHNWSTSFHGLSVTPFSAEIGDILQQEIHANDVEITPDGLLYLPEIKYRRILNKAFGPGGWGLAPRGDHSISSKNISREYALICHGRFVSQARGEQDFFDSSGLATAAEGCKSNALMRCCKDLGIASELWDPIYIRKFKKKYCTEVWTEHVVNKRKKKLWRKKDDVLDYPYKETGPA
ncbi:mitochondrial genome maintenance MGM101-domain-containing protein [Gongronella butleri]|nr:mitochondrial genome maintenance MGM101-domain-containing protein [Gongronella butleri]